MNTKRILVCGFLAMCLASPSAVAQVSSGTASPTQPGAQTGSFWSEPDEKALSEIMSGAYNAAEPVGSFSSHGGPDEVLGQLGKYYQNLSKGLDIQGKPIGGSIWRGWFSGADKASQWARFKESCAAMSARIETLGKAITIVDSGAKVAGHFAEKDYGGALLTVNDELAKYLALLLAAAGGTAVAGPVGAVGAAGAAEETWGVTGHQYFEWEKQRLKNLEKIFAHAGQKIRDPDIKAYMRGDLSTDELKRKVLEKRQKAKEKWLELAKLYPEIKADVDALVALNATSRQRARLLYVDRLDKAATNHPALHEALKAWLAGDVTRAQLNLLRAALGLPPLVYLEPAELVGQWSGGAFVITEAPVMASLRASAAAPSDPKADGLEGCDALSPEVMQGIAAALDKLLNQPLELAVTIAGDGTQGTITLRITPPAGVDASQNKPMAVRYQFRPNTILAGGGIHDEQGYLSLQGKVTSMRDGLSLKGSWELRGAKSGGKPGPEAAVMLRGTWSGKKPYSKPPGTTPGAGPIRGGDGDR